MGKLFLSIILVIIWLVPANGLVVRSGNSVVIPQDEVIDDDLFAFARSVRISGKVNGDVFVFAQEVAIENDVNGSVYTGGAQIKINLEKCRSIWAFCGSLDLDAKVERNLLFFGGQLKTQNNSSINKDIIAFGGEVNLNGEVQGKVKGNMGRLNLNAQIGDVDIKADEVNVRSGAVVKRNLIIKSSKEPIIDPNAQILGKTDYQKIEEKTQKRKTGLSGFFKWLFFFSKLIIGIILVALFRPYIKSTSEVLRISTWKSLGVGFLTVVVIPVITVITLATIIGIPIAIFGIFLFLTLAYVSGIVFATGFGEWLISLFKKDGNIAPILSFIVGFIIVCLISLIPFIGFFIRLAVFFFGTGMIVILIHKMWKNLPKTMESQ